MKWKDVMNDTYETTFTPTAAITDTGASCLIGPSEYVDIIYNSILAQTSVNVEDDGWGDIFWCSDIPNLPSFYLNFGGYWFEVKAEDYSIEVATDICAMCITAVEGYDEWILGDTFMRGWYNIHDHANQRMGFIPFPDSDKVTPEPRTEADVRPETEEEEAETENTNSSSDAVSVPVNIPSIDEDEPEEEILGMGASTFYGVAIMVTFFTVVTSLVLIIVVCYRLSMMMYS